MRLLQLRTGEFVDSSEVKSLIINDERKPYSKKELFDALKKLISVKLVLEDGRIIKDVEVKDFYLISME